MSGAHIAVQAHIKKRREKKEEEEMTRYNGDDLEEGWEFKIVRSVTGAFGKPEGLARMLDEEAQGGWELVEKFDDNRVRLKRPAAARRGDLGLPAGYDPYRTTYGLTEGGLAILIVAAVILLAGGILLLATLIS
jgi:hypothetical protein